MNGLKAIIEKRDQYSTKEFNKVVHDYLDRLDYRGKPSDIDVCHKDGALWISLSFYDPCDKNPIGKTGFQWEQGRLFGHTMDGGLSEDGDGNILTRSATMFKDKRNPVVLRQMHETWPYCGGGSEYQFVLDIICFDDNQKAENYLAGMVKGYMADVLQKQWKVFADSLESSRQLMSDAEQERVLSPCLEHPVFKKLVADMEDRVLQSLVDDQTRSPN